MRFVEISIVLVHDSWASTNSEGEQGRDKRFSDASENPHRMWKHGIHGNVALWDMSVNLAKARAWGHGQVCVVDQRYSRGPPHGINLELHRTAKKSVLR